MVCLKEGETSCTVHDTMPCAVEKKLSIVVRPSYTVGNVFNNVSTQFPNYQAFDLVLQSPNQEESVLLNDKKEKPLYEIPGFRQNEKNTLVLMPVGSYKHNIKSKVDIDEKISPASEDEIALGESASPTEPDTAYRHLPNTKSETSRRCDERFSAEDPQQTKLFPTPKIPKRYVGLVNQAMTCYLNSLLQALFMTPEFRNALYNWEFDQEGEAKSIPYQLQKLFLNLQTSTKIAIETTDLTKSFGWRSNEAWHQHDIQELCRVMFEALENKFKNTGQADLINNLYQGKMMDYVKCLECCTEKSREDTFLDIPLPVRPFKSAVAYGSVEEALRAFVQPETLDENNQYFCEKCNKKCDAHKGLKFTKFPYILTLHLKRFDFDYETLHRIKLNDMVTFPQTLNVSSFIKTEGNFQQNHNHVHVNGVNGFANESENGEKAVKFDDCSTTDSGAALEEDNCSGTATIASSVQHDGELQDDDEGIDMSSSTDNRSNTSNESNQYMYDLFAIMIHSGSASGGHYYAYIKDFDTGEWYCFNDQSVTPITQDDIEKSYGGGTKAYYSGAYSSSTNAYMLMYRQIDVKRNASAIKTEQFPDHIKSLLQKLKMEKDEEEKKPIISDLITRKVHFYNPALKTIKNSNIRLLWDSTFDHVLKRAHGILEVENFAPISRCRLVAYDHQSQEIERSLEGRENDLFGDVVSSLEPHLHFLLETRGENEEFDVYEPGGFTMKVFKININNGDIDGPYLVRAIETQSVQSFKKKIAKELRVNVEELIVVLETSCDGVVVLKDDAEKLYPRSKVYVACEKNYTDETGEKLKEFVNENFANMTFLYVSLPPIDKETLKILDIPEYVPRPETKESSLATPKSSPVEESISTETKISISSPKKSKGKKDSTSVSPKKEKTKSIKTPLSSPKKETAKNTVETTAKDLSASKDSKQASSVPPSASPIQNTQMSTSGSGTGSLMTSSSIQQYAGAVGGGGESNSEDSSLSDGDRTLVETAPLELSRVSSLSHSPQLSSPDDDICGPKSPPYLADDIPTDEEDDENLTESDRGLYFRAYLIQDYDCMTASFLNGKKSENDYSLKDTVPKERKLKVFLDKRMKISSLKRALEPHIQVSADYFKIVRKQTDLLTFDDGEEISIELGQVLKKGEYRVKVFHLKLNQPSNESISFTFICEKVLRDEIPVPVFKKDLLDHIHKLDPKYHTITMENSRLWDKNGRSLSRILQDDDFINSNLMFSTTCEIVIQEHEDEVCPVGSEDSLTLFVRRYCPSTLEPQPFQEITLEKNDELKETLSKLSGIPVDNIVYYKDTISFPVTNFDNNSIHWLTNTATLDVQPLLSSRSSSVYFYKDKTEENKKLTKEEKCDLMAQDKHRFEQILGFSSSYSPRREHSLKIYTDPSPVKTDKPSSADVDK